VDRVSSEWGSIEVLVNNAGIGSSANPMVEAVAPAVTAEDVATSDTIVNPKPGWSG